MYVFLFIACLFLYIYFFYKYLKERQHSNLKILDIQFKIRLNIMKASQLS